MAAPSSDNEKPVSPAARDESQEALETLREYGMPIATGLIIALVAVGGYQLYRGHKRTVALRSAEMLFNARTPSQLQDVANLYPDTPSGPIAALSLAANYFSDGQYEQARQSYQEFAQKYPEHPMKDVASYGLAMCMEASGRLNEALNAFTMFADSHPDHFLTPQATLGRGRCLDQMGKLEEARAVYEDFMAAHPQSPWVDTAESMRLSVEQQLRAQAAP